MFLCKWRARKQISLRRDNKVVLYYTSPYPNPLFLYPSYTSPSHDPALSSLHFLFLSFPYALPPYPSYSSPYPALPLLTLLTPLPTLPPLLTLLTPLTTLPSPSLPFLLLSLPCPPPPYPSYSSPSPSLPFLLLSLPCPLPSYPSYSPPSNSPLRCMLLVTRSSSRGPPCFLTHPLQWPRWT